MMTYALVINANRHKREMLTAALESDGIPTRSAQDEEEAIRIMQDEDPEVILWDWPARAIPPEIFVAVLRQERFDGNLVICAPGQEADEMPYDVLIRKPFELDHLVQTVARLMDGDSNDDPVSSPQTFSG